MKLSSMRYLVGQGVRNVWTNRVMSFASFSILTVSLLLVGFSILFTANINCFIGGVAEKNEIVIYLQDGTSDADIQMMQNSLETTVQNIASVQFVSKEQGFEDLKARYENADTLFSSLGDASFLPDAFRVRVKDVAEINSTVAAIRALGHIDTINAPKEFASILTGLRSTVGIISTAIVAVLIVVCLVIISNTTRASVFARRKEINIMKYVGATNSFIRIPFFVEGMFTGVLAGIAAALLTWAAYDSLIEILSQEMLLLNAMGVKEFIPFGTVAFNLTASYIVCGALIGAIGTVFSTRKHLKV